MNTSNEWPLKAQQHTAFDRNGDQIDPDLTFQVWIDAFVGLTPEQYEYAALAIKERDEMKEEIISEKSIFNSKLLILEQEISDLKSEIEEADRMRDFYEKAFVELKAKMDSGDRVSKITTPILDPKEEKDICTTLNWVWDATTGTKRIIDPSQSHGQDIQKII